VIICGTIADNEICQNRSHEIQIQRSATVKMDLQLVIRFESEKYVVQRIERIFSDTMIGVTVHACVAGLLVLHQRELGWNA
jgi:hypothetical protein